MYPGIKRVNWNCIGIQNFCDKCNLALKNLVSTIGQIDLIIKNIESSIINEVASFNLFTLHNFEINDTFKDCTVGKNSLKNHSNSRSKHQFSFEHSLQTFFSDIEKERNESFELMFQKYDSLLPILMKIEELAEGSVTEQRNAMFLFYEHYEQSILSSFLT